MKARRVVRVMMSLFFICLIGLAGAVGTKAGYAAESQKLTNRQRLQLLEDRFLKGEISEDAYKSMKAKIEEKMKPMRSKILDIYGGFEKGDLTGWKILDERPPIQYQVVGEKPRAGKYCLKVFLPLSEEKRGQRHPGVSINPYLTWPVERGCVVNFSVQALEQKTRWMGYYLRLCIKGKDAQGTEYRWNYLLFHAGQREFENAKKNLKAWNFTMPEGEREYFAWTPSIFPQSSTTYNEWIGGLYGFHIGVNCMRMKQWIDFKIDLSKSFEVEGAPAKPDTIKLNEVRFDVLTSAKFGSAWMLDDVSIEIQPQP